MPNANKAAFPSNYEEGLTKREEFAKAAMHGIISKGAIEGSRVGVCSEGFIDPRTVAKFALDYADALLDRIKQTKNIKTTPKSPISSKNQ